MSALMNEGGRGPHLEHQSSEQGEEEGLHVIVGGIADTHKGTYGDNNMDLFRGRGPHISLLPPPCLLACFQVYFVVSHCNIQARAIPTRTINIEGILCPLMHDIDSTSKVVQLVW
jgi:hypothetical protein